ncbi:hypothetical protein FVEG_16081 [Fusarium verticillioides 7600]|uniref:Uncharacterized protein n=1 Tax=Gibberella moniliformis (strain M3125 / FGSC 7600) TaxID=334819 RepID=W7MHV6_GIBM7|nr:hypothetical protein FVEG_16081 [Fusarium verticillioides 7600]EWG47184.1 hypothetical protein FVEG_16081 [Fusarium verticillioides 7600]
MVPPILSPVESHVLFPDSWVSRLPFLFAQITKFALCYPNVGRGLSQGREGVDAAPRAIPCQEQLQLHGTDERLVVVIAVVNYLPSPDTDTAIVNPTARLSHPDISN